MKDPRFDQLAKLIVSYSVRVKNGDRVMVDTTDVPDGFVVSLIRAVRQAGGIPVVIERCSRVNREIAKGITDREARLYRDIELFRMKKMTVYIGIRGSENASENADVPSDRMQLYMRRMREVVDWRVKNTRWCVLRWPTPSMAQSAGMSTEAFEDFFFKVCTFDYSRMANAVKPLSERMKKADKVRIVGPGTDLTFSIKGLGAVPCVGHHNIPDGEVFSCPIKTSVEGVIQFNAPTIYAGTRFENIRLVFKKGKIVQAEANNTKKLNEILDTDEDARYLGEFSLGINPYINEPMGDILFDEKISGSLHLAVGRAYDECDNGNRSAIHWDLVLIQRPEWGGGEVWFDGELIRKDGKFVPRDLQKLNPENLRKQH